VDHVLDDVPPHARAPHRPAGLRALADHRIAAVFELLHQIHGGHDRSLRETVIALVAGHELAEHESPGEATLQVMRGRVRLTAGDDVWESEAGGHVIIPGERHALAALEDSVVLLTVVEPVP
jgi:quercetin dioxygenase-like cupin family protein